MKFVIKHEIKGRIRAHAVQYRMTFEQADRMQYYLESQDMITSAKVQNRTGDFTICYKGDREKVIKLLQTFRYEEVDIPENYAQNSGRELNQEYWDKLVETVIYHYGNKLFLPYSVRACITAVKSVKYLWMGVRTLAKGKIEVPVLDATAIGVSMFRGDIATAGSVMFLLGIGEILEEWTHKKSVGDLARSMSLNISKVWLVSDGQEVLVPFSSVKSGDRVRIHMGNVIPFDGTVVEGEAMVNQASLTGESVAVRKIENGEVYAGTVVEEGELTIRVREANGSSKFEKIVTMIEESEKLKSGLESKAEHLADKLVPYTLAGTGLTYLLTRNVTKALAVLMVDFSCALKLAMPISVLSAIREASSYNVTVKGGKYLEAMAEADTIVFDKTGTLTKAQPTVVDVVPFCDKTPDELLRIGACLEEHFPHSMAKAVVNAAQEKGLIHEEFHSKVEYIVAHGISSKINDQKVVVGSYHFVFEDEGEPDSRRNGRKIPRTAIRILTFVHGNRRKTGSSHLHRRPAERRSTTDHQKSEGSRHQQSSHDDRGQQPHRKSNRQTRRRGRILLGSIAGRQGKLRRAGKSRRTKSHHDRRRNQRFTGTVRSRHRNRNQRWRRDRPRNRRRDHERRRLERDRNTEADQ